MEKVGNFELNKVYCIEKKVDMSELLEKLIEKELKKDGGKDRGI
jgi:hypothetical protein